MPSERIPEDLRVALMAKGHTRLELGNLRLDLLTGRHTRPLLIDGNEVANLTFPGREIDWDIVREAVQ